MPTAVTVWPAVPFEISKSSAIIDNKLTGMNSEAIRQVTPKHKVMSTGLSAFCGELLMIACIFTLYIYNTKRPDRSDLVFPN